MKKSKLLIFSISVIFFLLSMDIIISAQGLTIGSGTTFSLGSSELYLPGNWNNSGTFNPQNGVVILNGPSGNQTITNSNVETFYDLVINKNSDDVQLDNNITVTHALTVTKGDIDLNGQIITLASNAVLSETEGNTVKGLSGKITITKNVGVPSSNNVGGLGAVITSGSDLGETTVERYHSAAIGASNTGILREFNITPTNNSGLNAALKFYYDESELNGITENTLDLFKSTDGTDNSWNIVNGGIVNTTNNYIELSGINDFSYWTIASSDAPLPVQMVSFWGVSEGNIVKLTWSTETEINNYGFEIQRSVVRDQQAAVRSPQSAVSSGQFQWKTVGFIKGSGNSNSPKQYSFIDKNPVGGSEFNYRLKRIDLNGEYTYTDKIYVEIKPDKYYLYQNYPNPFNPMTTIKFQLPSAGNISLKIYDVLGNKVATLIDEEKAAGQYQVNFNAKGLSSGVYFYVIHAGNFVGIKKLILLR